jgi:D-serine deaminase-like pyridoxal phosphate-dependent protein
MGKEMIIVAGGSASFATHRERKVECSPGTFVFWDWNYLHLLPETPFELAALVITRICSIVDPRTVTLDLGHKSVAAENPLPRVHFLNAPAAVPIAQSEEHLVVQVPDSSIHEVGEVWYGVPVHICPTVALYEEVQVVKDHTIAARWRVVARDKKITI